MMRITDLQKVIEGLPAETEIFFFREGEPMLLDSISVKHTLDEEGTKEVEILLQDS